LNGEVKKIMGEKGGDPKRSLSPEITSGNIINNVELGDQVRSSDLFSGA
jgi:hypothetical protein